MQNIDKFTGHIEPELFQFFKELKENNNKLWFEENKQRYESQVREPLLRFVSDFSFHLSSISLHYIAEPRMVGGSLFRIYRDVRFSKDKTPYKTHAGIQFRHERGKDAHAPGFYLHLEPENVFAAAGVWKPDSVSLGKIRDAIVDHPTRWQNIFTDEEFASIYKLEGDSLQKAPKGYDPTHTLIDDLKRKDYFVMTAFTEEDTLSADFIIRYANVCQIASPFMEFLTKAIGLPW